MPTIDWLPLQQPPDPISAARSGSETAGNWLNAYLSAMDARQKAALGALHGVLTQAETDRAKAEAEHLRKLTEGNPALEAAQLRAEQAKASGEEFKNTEEYKNALLRNIAAQAYMRNMTGDMRSTRADLNQIGINADIPGTDEFIRSMGAYNQTMDLKRAETQAKLHQAAQNATTKPVKETKLEKGVKDGLSTEALGTIALDEIGTEYGKGFASDPKHEAEAQALIKRKITDAQQKYGKGMLALPAHVPQSLPQQQQTPGAMANLWSNTSLNPFNWSGPSDQVVNAAIAKQGLSQPLPGMTPAPIPPSPQMSVPANMAVPSTSPATDPLDGSPAPSGLEEGKVYPHKSGHSYVVQNGRLLLVK